MIVGRAYGIARRVGELQFDMVVVVGLLVQDCGGEPPKAVSGHSAFEAHSLYRSQDRHIAHGFLGITVSRKEKLAIARKSLERIQDLKRLPGQWYNVCRPHLHSLEPLAK